jgi:hypothetical protein
MSSCRILLAASSHSGMSSEDRGYLVQLVGVTTGLAAPEAEKMVEYCHRELADCNSD